MRVGKLHGPPGEKLRNQEIERRARHVSLTALAKEHGISIERVRQIVNRERAARKRMGLPE